MMSFSIRKAEADDAAQMVDVSPEARFNVVSKAMMAALENEARALGCREATLESSLTAHGFYRSIGYVDSGEAGEKYALPNFPMRRVLQV